jgi:hypothetical protein
LTIVGFTATDVTVDHKRFPFALKQRAPKGARKGGSHMIALMVGQIGRPVERLPTTLNVT